ncbi:MAG: PIN/TRAM domain-containing protein [Dehalococcoidia bacterium]
MFIERLLRIVGAIFFGFIGLRMGQFLAEGDSGIVWLVFWVAPPVLWMVFGVLASPYIFLGPLRKFQQWIGQVEPAQLVLGTIGLVAGLVVAAILTPALSSLPRFGGLIAPFLTSIILGTLGVATMVGREEEFIRFISRYLPGLATRNGSHPPRQLVMDTSAIIDGRIADICDTGFIQSTLVVPRFVLEELRHIADSPEALRRNRGRRGLDVLSRLQRESAVPVQVTDMDFEGTRDVDSKLIRLAKALGCSLITNDYNLSRIAEVEGVRVLNIHHLANAVKTVVLPGEEMAVRIVQEGKEMGQGVGFLDDGTMVVVEGGRRYLNDQLDVVVTRVLQTIAGRMIFAQPKPSNG